MELPTTLPSFLLALTIVAAAAGLQATVGFGFALVSVPLLMLIDPVLAPVPLLVTALPLGVAIFWRERQHADLRGVRWLLLGRIPGAALGMALLAIAPNDTLDLLLGGFILSSVLLIASGWKVPRNPWTKLVAGTASGTFSLVSAIGGPPLALLYREEKGPTLRSSLAAVFAVGLLLNLVVRGVGGELTIAQVHCGLLLAPGLLVGLLIGRRLSGSVEGRPLKILVLAISGLASVGILLRALLA